MKKAIDKIQLRNLILDDITTEELNTEYDHCFDDLMPNEII